MGVPEALAEPVGDRLRSSIGRDEMDFSSRFEDLEKRTAAALASVKSAATESRDQLRERIDQAQVDLDLAGKDAEQKAGEAAERAQSKWAQMKADADALDARAYADERARAAGSTP
jgi:D-alanyl-D-alanine dipeptidase